MGFRSMFRTYLTYLAFLLALCIQNRRTSLFFLAFLEFLNFNSTSHAQIRNHISAIKQFSTKFSLPVKPLSHGKITMYLNSLQKSAKFTVKLHHIVHLSFLSQIVKFCDKTYIGGIFKVMYLHSFFGFLRLSNLVPHSVSTFSHFKHLTKGMCFFTPT